VVKVPSPQSRLLFGFLAGQSLIVALLWVLPPDGWLHSAWSTFDGWGCAAIIVVGVRRNRPLDARAWYAIAAGSFLSSCGTLVETFVWRFFGVTTNPNAADAFWLSLYPGLVVGVGALVYQRAAREDLGAMMLNTAICLLVNLFMGILAWELIVWRVQADLSLTLYNRVVVTIYPLADLTLVALVLRLLLSSGFRNPSVALVVAAFAGFLAADLGWSTFLRSGETPSDRTIYLLNSVSMAARGLLGAAALHPSMGDVAPARDDRQVRLGALGWVGLVASVVTAPLVLLLQAVLDLLYSVTSF
jgi:hypothetical protein